MFSDFFTQSNVKGQWLPVSTGFSLLELMLVVAILAILGTAGFGMYHNFVKNVELSSMTQTIRTDLKSARSKAQAGNENYRWGIHFVNGTNDYYEVFSTPTNYADVGKEVRETIYLRGGVKFSDPMEDNNKDVIFARISGTTTAATVAVTFSGQTETINVGISGSVN